MRLSHRIALDPTENQRNAFARAAGVARFTWNWALAESDRVWRETGKLPDFGDLKKRWNSIKRMQFPWICESPKDANQQPFTHLRMAYIKYFRDLKSARRAGKPDFKRKGEHDSFYVGNTRLLISGNCARLPVIGWVSLCEPLRFTGKIMGAAVVREADRWFISVQVDTEVAPLPKVDKTVGVDLGVSHAVTTSDGHTFDAPNPLKANLKNLRRVQRKLSRQQKGSKNREKTKLKLARLHARISNIRKDWTHKLTTRLIRENQAVCIEDLNVSGMLHRRAVRDIGFYEIRRQLTYKAAISGRTLNVVDRWFPSSKTCSACGHRKASLALSERTFRCGVCGLTLNRDLNAAINIRTAGLAGNHACGQEGSDGRHTPPMKPCLAEAGTSSLVPCSH